MMKKHRQRRALTETENYSRLCSISCLTLLYHKCDDIGATTELIYLMVQHDIFIPFTLEAVCPSNTLMPHILIHFRLNHHGSAIYTNAETTDKPINKKLREEAENQKQPSVLELDSPTRQIHARSSRHDPQRVVPREMP